MNTEPQDHDADEPAIPQPGSAAGAGDDGGAGDPRAADSEHDSAVGPGGAFGGEQNPPTPGDTDVEVTYEHDQRGHRVTRRIVRRREVTEDTQETITETYPVPHQPPTPAAHPAPVG